MENALKPSSSAAASLSDIAAGARGNRRDTLEGDAREEVRSDAGQDGAVDKVGFAPRHAATSPSRRHILLHAPYRAAVANAAVLW